MSAAKAPRSRRRVATSARLTALSNDVSNTGRTRSPPVSLRRLARTAEASSTHSAILGGSVHSCGLVCGALRPGLFEREFLPDGLATALGDQIGRASCRERV